MNVFLVYSGSYEDRDVDSVHATLAGAKAAHMHDGSWVGEGPHWRCGWTRVHHSAKVPITSLAFETLSVPVVNGVATLADGRTIDAPEGVRTVVVPVPPKDWTPFRPDWTEDCDVTIVEREVIP